MTAWLILVQNDTLAGKLWKQKTRTTLASFSNTRWWSRQEVENNITLHFGLLPEFLEELESRGIGDATTKKMLSIYRRDPLQLEVFFAAGYDGLMRMLQTTYNLEGDRLAILLAFRQVESLRAYGSQLAFDNEKRGLLPNTDAVIRRALEPAVGLVIKKEFPGHGIFTGKIHSIDIEDSAKWWYLIEYEDGDTETMDLQELRPHLSVHGSALRKFAIDGVVGAFKYLEDRLNGKCDSSYDCTHTYAVFKSAQLFDPSFVAENSGSIDASFVQQLACIVPLARANDGSLVSDLEGELPDYLSAAAGFTCDHTDVVAFTEAVLGWWRNHGNTIPKWSAAARIVFALSPNSCPCERVFSLLESMFGSGQETALADYLQAALMLRYNKRLQPYRSRIIF
ncbi:hypothetical protein CYMTET_11697 [Cymbomonas tetramitiformis]|uniref:HAT C-terminal dimerisation domain-containing protein n=1 Tax=Cymbomonas tetramitiformis TaxID=36881 RepID=A0AAE0GLR2_9CHLO|nr:hypothetical protein CYMTET_11697 [Cymbomonas tetramitiformis]